MPELLPTYEVFGVNTFISTFFKKRKKKKKKKKCGTFNEYGKCLKISHRLCQTVCLNFVFYTFIQ